MMTDKESYNLQLSMLNDSYKIVNTNLTDLIERISTGDNTTQSTLSGGTLDNLTVENLSTALISNSSGDLQLQSSGKLRLQSGANEYVEIDANSNIENSGGFTSSGDIRCANLYLTGNLKVPGDLELPNSRIEINGSYGTNGQVLMSQGTNSLTWTSLPVKVFFQVTAAANQSIAATTTHINNWTLAFPDSSPTAETQFTAGTHNFFRCRKAGLYKIQASISPAHVNTGACRVTAYLDKNKLYTDLTNDYVTAAASYDFRLSTYTALGSTNTRAYTLTGQGDVASLIIDAGAPDVTISTTDGIPGATSNFIRFRAEDIPLHGCIGTGSLGFSFEMSIKLNADTDGSILDVDTTPYSSTNSLFKVFYRSNLGELTIVYIDYNGDQVNTADTSTILLDYTKFVHLIITMSAGGQLKVYQNNSNTNTFNLSHMGNASDVTSVQIGRERNAQTLSLRDGCIEEIRFLRFYDLVLNTTQISNLYKAHVSGEVDINIHSQRLDYTPPSGNGDISPLFINTIKNLEVDDRLSVGYTIADLSNPSVLRASTIGTLTNVIVESMD